jgi:hypothetical protein
MAATRRGGQITVVPADGDERLLWPAGELGQMAPHAQRPGGMRVTSSSMLKSPGRKGTQRRQHCALEEEKKTGERWRGEASSLLEDSGQPG